MLALCRNTVETYKRKRTVCFYVRCDGGQAAPQRVDCRAVVAAGAKATDGSEPPEDAGMGTRATRSLCTVCTVE